MEKRKCYGLTMEHYLGIKEDEILSFTGKWMEMEVISLNEISQTQ
jgi:hypothetical protein